MKNRDPIRLPDEMEPVLPWIVSLVIVFAVMGSVAVVAWWVRS